MCVSVLLYTCVFMFMCVYFHQVYVRFKDIPSIAQDNVQSFYEIQIMLHRYNN